jgi:hypothetical protein
MSDHSITSLIEKLEGVEVGNRELDALVHVAVANDPNTYVVEPAAESIFSHKPGWYRTGTDLSVLADPVTTSLDAALALAERVVGEEAALSILQDTVDGWNAAAGLSIRSLPRLLCAAVLRAQSEARV